MTSLASSFRILVADDEPEIRELLTEILAADGAEVVAVGDGLAAWHEARLAPFDLCLLDVEMPQMDGYEACVRLRETPFTRNLPILFLTGRTDKASVDEAFAAGASDYLCKPIHPLLLRRRVANLLALSRLLREKDALVEVLKFVSLTETGPGIPGTRT
jgi:CheY-like chemotaxis protein